MVSFSKPFTTIQVHSTGGPHPHYPSHRHHPAPSSSSEAPRSSSSPSSPSSSSSELAGSLHPLREGTTSSTSASDVMSWAGLMPEGEGEGEEEGRLNFPYTASTVIPDVPRSQGSGGRGSDLTDSPLRESESDMIGMSVISIFIF